MSEPLLSEAAEHGRPHAEGGEHGAHPTDAQYVRIAVILALVTAVEVGLYYTSFSKIATNTLLLGLAGIKFVMVAAYFMHLKFDNKILRRLFVTGFVLATFCYIAYLLTLGVFI
ncbi:MAG TPA: cytochrome C oxidase subunit IV family protein [Acidimicrobiales bacterium]|jgi:cytochrome c oxidase subunit IV|nr:cytochrome C oxidase subunit IV family protein [Acidimicrobiales bacterium]